MLVANILTRRIYDRYQRQKELAMGDKLAEPPNLVITIEEAHRFLSSSMSGQTIFGTIAREMRKYNVTLLVVDQRPSDIDEEAVQLARENGSIHGIDIEAVQADLFSGIPWTEPFDLLLSVLPQKPCEPGQLPLANDGGPEGTSLLLPVIREAPSRLADSGHLLLFLHSLAHPEALVSLHQQYDVEVLSITERIFSKEEFPGLIDQWEKRRERNACYFEEQPHARLGFTCMILKARPKR